ncbi:MAG: hypothetical protein ACQKBW_03355, partial [Puniceicoccales bacterium]
MDILVGEIGPNKSSSYSEEELDRAYHQADGILRSYRFLNTWHRHQCSREIVEETVREHPAGDLGQCVAEKTLKRVDAWFNDLADALGIHYERLRPNKVRLAAWNEACLERWPECFLKKLPPP